jgi:CubicO group peptidase (beta-lactamase class C family)
MKMRYVTATLLIIWALPELAQSQSSATSDLTKQIDSIVGRWSSTETPGCAVAVAQNGQVVLSRAYGMADLEHGVINSPETIFEAGSVSKQFTAASVVLLAQRGKLALDDDVRKYIPELPNYGSTITLRHLLNHTSGLRDWGAVTSVAGWPRGSRNHSLAHALDVIIHQKTLNFPPGSEYSYSNSGFNLLAIIAERVSGESLAKFAKKNIFDPLGMTHTSWRDDFTRIVKGRAIAYSRRQDAFVMDMPFENVYGQGGLLTTVGDLLLWNENFAHGKVGGPSLAEELQKTGQLTNGRRILYAEGLVVTTYKGLPVVSHSGATAGYRAFLVRFPKQHLSVALLSNLGAINPEQLAYQAAEVFLREYIKEEKKPTPVSLSPDVLKAKAGLYRNTHLNAPARLEVREEKLYVGKVELVPLSDSLFLIGRGPGFVVFSSGKGEAGSFQSIAGDDTTFFNRTQEVSPTADQLKGYEGLYYSDEVEVTFDAVVREGKLVLHRRPDSIAALTSSYEDVFVAPNAFGGSEDWVVRFARGKDGKVDGLSIGLSRATDLRFVRSARF